MASAQHADVVAAVKASLLERGIPILGPCGAYEITKRVAWRLREESAGTYEKLTGNNCQGRSIDIISYPDGRIYDVLQNAENDNIPAWNLVNQLPENSARWRPVLTDPDSGVLPTPPQPPAPPVPSVPPSIDLSEILHKLETILQHIDEQHFRMEELAIVNQNEHHATQDRLKQHDEHPTYLSHIASFITNPTFLAILGGLATGKFALGK
jgi:hypothetical protein